MLLGWALDNCSWEPAIPQHMGFGLFVWMACGHLFVSCSLDEALAEEDCALVENADSANGADPGR